MRPACGIVTAASQSFCTQRPDARPLRPQHEDRAGGHVDLPRRRSAFRVRCVAPQVGPLGAAKQLGEVRRHRDADMLDGAGRGLRHDRRDPRRAVARQHQAVRARAVAGAHDRAEVARVGDAVEHDDERVLARQQLEGVDVRVRIGQRGESLMIRTAREGRDCIHGADLERRPPRSGLDEPVCSAARSVQ